VLGPGSLSDEYVLGSRGYGRHLRWIVGRNTRNDRRYMIPLMTAHWTWDFRSSLCRKDNTSNIINLLHAFFVRTLQSWVSYLISYSSQPSRTFLASMLYTMVIYCLCFSISGMLYLYPSGRSSPWLEGFLAPLTPSLTPQLLYSSPPPPGGPDRPICLAFSNSSHNSRFDAIP